VSEKKPAKPPVWYHNTFFWIGVILLILGIYGLPFLGGDKAIRDPGQKRESSLFIYYLLGGLVMIANGWLSHKQSVASFEEESGQASVPPVSVEN
jgi:uncharacterized membrane protein YsdA (DUF1294 family)